MLFKVIQEYLGYDNLVEEGNKEVVRFKVEKFKLISEQIIPFFFKKKNVYKSLIFIILTLAI